MMLRVCISLFLFLHADLILALPPVSKLEISENSIITIEGKSNLVDFSCFHSLVEGNITIDSLHFLDLRLKIRVENLNCGHERINKDMRKAMQNDLHPFIFYQIEQTCNLISDRESENKWTASTQGKLEIAGVEQEVCIEFELQKELSGHYRVKGEKILDMTSFGISPPKALMGLIKVKKQLKLFFDLEVISITK